MNTLTYKGYDLLDGPHNFFRLESGTRPSFGLFRCAEDAQLALSGGMDASGSLVFSDSTNTVTLPGIYIVEIRPASGAASAGFPDSNNEYGLYDLVLADSRVLWINIAGDKNYNMYKAARAVSGGEYEIQEINGASNWTWPAMINDLAGLLGVTINDPKNRISDLDSEPRNIMAKGRPVSDVLEEILSFLGLVLLPTLTLDTYKVQSADDYDKDWKTSFTGLSKVVYEGGSVKRNEKILPKNIGLRVSSSPTPSIDPSIELTDTAVYETSGVGDLYLDVKHAGVLSSGSLVNETQLNTLRDDLITTHTQPDPEVTVTLAGIYDLTTYDFTDIEWRSNNRGAFTKGQIKKPKVSPPEAKDGLFNYGSFYVPRTKVGWFKTYIEWTYSAEDNGCYVYCHPCADETGANPDTSVNVKVWLPRKGVDADPNVAAGVVLAAARTENEEYVALDSCLDGKVYRSIRAWHGTSIPSGWTLCDGSLLSNNPESYYPDLGGRVLVGYYANGLGSTENRGACGDYASIGWKWGTAWHGENEYTWDDGNAYINNHPEHADHIHSTTITGITADDSSNAGPCGDIGTWWSGVQKESTNHYEMKLRHGGIFNDWVTHTPADESFDHADTDNRMPLYTVAWIIRKDNSAGGTIPIPSELQA